MARPIETEPCGRGLVARKGFRDRAGAVTGRRNLSVYCVEGEHVTLAQVAERLGVTRDTASERLRRERAKDGPVTWSGLR